MFDSKSDFVRVNNFLDILCTTLYQNTFSKVFSENIRTIVHINYLSTHAVDNLALKRIWLALSKPKAGFVDYERAKEVAIDLDACPDDYVSSNDNIPNMNIASVGDNKLVKSVLQSIKYKLNLDEALTLNVHVKVSDMGEISKQYVIPIFLYLTSKRHKQLYNNPISV